MVLQYFIQKSCNFIDDNEKKYLQGFQRSLIYEGYMIIKFIFIKNRNKSYSKNIEFKKSISNEGVISWNEIYLDSKEKIDSYEVIIMQLTEGISKLKENKQSLDTIDCVNEEFNGEEVCDNNIFDGRRKIDKKNLENIDISSIGQDSESMSRSLYIKRIKELQLLLSSKQQKLLEEEKSLIILYEGWDASGKGGNIKRVVKRLDPTLYKVVPISAPTEEEKKYHYMKSFWECIPEYGKITMFDRSWYGRVLVEKVEMLTEPWKIEKAYDEVNMLEEFLMENRCILIKIFINISKDEQLKRFNKSMNNPFKSYKITNEDWRNRGKWEQYEKL